MSFDPKTNPAICLYPFVQLSTVPAGFFRPCCYYGEFLHDFNNYHPNVKTDRVGDVWNDSSMRELRERMIAGEPSVGCQQCVREEQGGSTTSMRFRSFTEWGENLEVQKLLDVEALRDNNYQIDQAPRYLEIKPGNLCNLKCRMCNQWDSSTIAKELTELRTKYAGVNQGNHFHLTSDKNTIFEATFSQADMPDWDQLDQFWDDISAWLPQVETLSFAGGEPTLLNSVHRLIDTCIQTGHASHITVFLSSNFTNLKQSLLDAAPHFKKFEFISSIDGYGEIQEYIRHPSKWSAVEKNYLRVKDIQDGRIVKLLSNITLQMNNILHFTDLLEFIDQYESSFWQWPWALNLLYGPGHLNIEYLPEELRPIVIERIDAFIARSTVLKRFPDMRERFELIKSIMRKPFPKEKGEAALKKFYEITLVLDEHRKEKLSEVDPLLWDSVHKIVQGIYAENRQLG